METLKAVVDTIDDVANIGIGERAVTARNLRGSIHSSFAVQFVTMEWILKICGEATEALQGKSETMQTSLDLNASMGTLLDCTAPPQADVVWDAPWRGLMGW